MSLLDKFKEKLGEAGLQPKDLIIPIAGAFSARMAMQTAVMGGGIGAEYLSSNPYAIGGAQTFGSYIGGGAISIPVFISYSFMFAAERANTPEYKELKGFKKLKKALSDLRHPGELGLAITLIGAAINAAKIGIAGKLISEGHDPYFVGYCCEFAANVIRTPINTFLFFDTLRNVRKPKKD